jgi:hypothetical protein
MARRYPQMKSIGIVGAGQSGLQLAIGLRQAGQSVVLLSAQTPEEIRNGRVTSSQCMFGTALEHERRVGLNLWDDLCPAIDGIEFAVAGGGAKPQMRWDARLDRPARSVDQRLKMPRLMEQFSALGGELRFQEVHLPDLEELTRECALVMVSAGKGAIANIFERDAVRSEHDRPMRALALTYVKGLVPRAGFAAVCFNLIPGVGEYFVFPALTTSGPCEIMVFEGIPGGPMDCWGDVRSPEGHLETSLGLLRRFVPWEFERAGSVSLTDTNGILAGRFPPTVRHPLARLPSGAVVLGMGDVVCLNDPITGQGSNNASKCASVYLQRIVERGTDPYDIEWMRETFETYWRYAQHVTRWTNMMLRPPPEHMLQLLQAGQTQPRVAHWFVNGFDNPPVLFPQIADAAAAARFLAIDG